LLAVGAGVIAWVVIAARDGSSTKVTPNAIKPVGLSASGLATLTRAVGQPIYWAGPQTGYVYELSRLANGSVYVRYLPPGVEVGVKSSGYLIVATYPFPKPLDALKKVSEGRAIRVPGGGLALVDQKTPKSVYLAFPDVDYQVEIKTPRRHGLFGWRPPVRFGRSVR
jgi:hypothetical protein